MRAWRSTFGVGLFGATSAFLLSAALVQTGCENRQVAVFTVEGRPGTASVLGVYSRINSGEWKGDVVRNNLDQFGVEVPLDTSGLLETQAFAYQNDLPCSLGTGTGTVEMPGKYRQNSMFAMSSTTNRCVGASEPVDFPKQKLAVWAAAPNDIWIAGDGGRILHWNGSTYRKIALPPDLQAAPPNWTTVYGRSAQDVWFAAAKNVVARYTNEALQTVKVNGPMLATGLPDWEYIAPGDPNLGDLWLAGSNGTFGYVVSGASTADYLPFNCRASTPVTQNLHSVSCLTAATLSAPNGYLYKCIFVGDGGRVVSYTSPVYNGGFTCENVPIAQTSTLRGVWLGLKQSTLSYDALVVGDGGLVLYGLGSVALAGDPVLGGMNSDQSMSIPPSSRGDFAGVTGFGIENVWLYGKRGSLVKWKATAIMGQPLEPFVEVKTGSQKDLTGGYALQSGFFGVGAGPDFIYNGELFKPTP